MHTTVIIPARPTDRGVLAWTLEGYAVQRLAARHRLDVRIGVDGADKKFLNGSIQSDGIGFTTVGFPCMGAAAVRNALVRESNADLLIFGNADGRPEPDMVQQHVDAMAKLPHHSIVLGASPWERISPTVLDVLIDQTPMVFSYCHMKPHTWYDFRCAYTLNLSVRKVDFVDAGGFHEELRPVYYEDLAFACRLLGPERKGVWHEPAARVLHRHPFTLDKYLDREELLGLMAPVLAKICPEAFARILANREAAGLEHDFRARVQGDMRVYRNIYSRVSEKFALPETALGEGEDRSKAIMALYQLHMPLKLLAFRLGFLRGLELVDDALWQMRQPQGLWRNALRQSD